jgi:GAF domain-containing protein
MGPQMASKTGRATMNSTTNNENFQSAAFSYTQWRDNFLRVLLRGAVVVGLLVTIVAYISTPNYLQVMYIGAYIAVALLAFIKFSYRVRAIGFVVVLLVVGVSNLLETGVRVDARLFMLTATLVAAMLFGIRAGGITAAVGIALIAITGFFVLTGVYKLVGLLDRPGNLLNWITSTSVLIMLEAILLLGLNLLQRGFDSAQQQAQELFQVVQTERQQLEQSVNERTAQLQAGAEVGRAATSILNPEDLMSEIVNLIANRFGYYYAAIFTLDRTGSYLILREATGEAGRTLKERGHRLRVSMDSMVGYTALRREPRIAQNISEDTVRFANPLLPDTQAEVALPLLVGQDVIGALDVQSTHLNAFDEGTLATLQAMASQVAVALQNAQSFQSLQKTLDYTTRQYELSRNIFLAQTPNEAYLTLGQVFAMFSDVDRIQLLRVTERDANRQPTVYELAIEWDILGGAQMNTEISYAAAETPLAALVAEDEAIVIRDASDTHLPVTTREQLAQANARAIILVPLQIGVEYSGFVAAISEQPREFTDNEIRLLKATAEQLGVVLANLQLTAEMQTTVERVALLNRRLSGEAWDNYRAGRARQRIESGRIEFLAAEHQLQVPIVVRGEAIGTFNVADSNLEREWQADELSLLQTIAGEVALAIDNARLIEQTQRTAQREKDIAVAADQIHRSMNLETILNTALGEITRITGVEDVAIQFGSLASPPGNGQNSLSSSVP